MRHLLSINDLSASDAIGILDTATELARINDGACRPPSGEDPNRTCAEAPKYALHAIQIPPRLFRQQIAAYHFP